ncbi:uncharacterized protein Z518_05355 [Rhinocladiella mackenziei CBS 650.93]|uniref:Uncharacterized protein n=1 Tax=Rhinocladiella mackenziei CBS 650.93 TaxID=1442369 RepID=A0A0D2J619_9EURO|nr:uncharacterized protein Z518_05355 [Rhinocladiella mackenziei CBS 650.93]KIX04485.1 hypothetical protein Z518_05355 [Rhinocladiella mackenziei CBS 650.93]
MSSSTNNFLPLIPAAHRVAVISSLDNAANDVSVIPALQKTRRSSSTATADSNDAAEEPVLPSETVDPIVESPTEAVNVRVNAAQPEHRFLKLGY